MSSLRSGTKTEKNKRRLKILMFRFNIPLGETSSHSQTLTVHFMTTKVFILRTHDDLPTVGTPMSNNFFVGSRVVVFVVPGLMEDVIP